MQGKPEFTVAQLRCCITLCERQELFEKKILGLKGEDERFNYDQDHKTSHVDLFGDFAIGLDPLVARKIGFTPTFYYSAYDIWGKPFDPHAQQHHGISGLVISRLKEFRDILTVLAFIQANMKIQNNTNSRESVFSLPSITDLKEIGFDLPFETEIMERIKDLDQPTQRLVQNLFQLDTEPAYNLRSYIDIIINLYQQTDSKDGGRSLHFTNKENFESSIIKERSYFGII